MHFIGQLSELEEKGPKKKNSSQPYKYTKWAESNNMAIIM